MKSRRLRISRIQPESRCQYPPLHLPVPLPFLRLQGRWLDQAGFAIGAQVRVQVMPRRLVLEVIETERTVEHDVQRARQSTAG